MRRTGRPGCLPLLHGSMAHAIRSITAAAVWPSPKPLPGGKTPGWRRRPRSASRRRRQRPGRCADAVGVEGKEPGRAAASRARASLPRRRAAGASRARTPRKGAPRSSRRTQAGATDESDGVPGQSLPVARARAAASTGRPPRSDNTPRAFARGGGRGPRPGPAASRPLGGLGPMYN